MNLCADWVTTADVDACGVDTSLYDADLVASAITAGSDWLYQNSGRRWSGVCETDERPCGCGCGCAAYGTFPWPGVVSDFDAWAAYYGTFADANTYGLCSCSSKSIIETTYGPVTSITSIVIGGSTLDSGKYVIVPPNRIMRTDGEAWPSCQDYSSASTGMIVKYRHGEAPPALGELAAADLVSEILRSCGGEACALPPGTVAVTRRNVSVNLDPEQAGRALVRVGMFLDAYPKQTTKPDVRRAKTRGLITSGPATPP